LEYMSVTAVHSVNTETGQLEIAHLRIENAQLSVKTGDTFGRWIVAEAIDQLASEADGTIKEPLNDRPRRWRLESKDSKRLARIRDINEIRAANNTEAIKTITALGAFARNIDLSYLEVVPGKQARFVTCLCRLGEAESPSSCIALKPSSHDNVFGATEYDLYAPSGLPEGLDHNTIINTAGNILDRAIDVYRGVA
jgi:hypothetical protein